MTKDDQIANLEAQLGALTAAATELDDALSAMVPWPSGEISAYADPVWHPRAVAARNGLRVCLGRSPFDGPDPDENADPRPPDDPST